MSNIKAGDLVVVTRPLPCCGIDLHIGDIHRVQRLFIQDGECAYCGKQYALVNFAGMTTGNNLPIFMLRRIDPLPESETQDNHESLTA